MAKSKPTAPTVVEHVIRHGKQGVFSHPDEAVARGKLAALKLADAANGAEKEYTLSRRTVVYDAEELPVGETSIGVKGEVSEEKL